VVNAIRANAAGAACAIQFGDGAAVLNTGTAAITFNNTGGTWGAVSLSGKITSVVLSTVSATVQIIDTVVVTSTADIANTSSGAGGAIFYNSTGALTISGGTVSMTGGPAIRINSSGKVTVSGTAKVTSAYTSSGTIFISTILGAAATDAVRLEILGGTVENTSENGHAVYKGTGSVTVSGGTVSAIGGNAIRSIEPTGKVTVSGTARVTSSSSTADYAGTICLQYFGTNTAAGLEITGGTVENTSATTGNAVYNNSTGTVNITGGTVSKAGSGGYAVNNRATGKITIGTGARITGQRFGVQ
jgi:hypothetical protein